MNIKVFTLIAVPCFFVIYGMTSFYFLTFDPTLWSADGRMAFNMLLVSVLFIAVCVS